MLDPMDLSMTVISIDMLTMMIIIRTTGIMVDDNNLFHGHDLFVTKKDIQPQSVRNEHDSNVCIVAMVIIQWTVPNNHSVERSDRLDSSPFPKDHVRSVVIGDILWRIRYVPSKWTAIRFKFGISTTTSSNSN